MEEEREGMTMQLNLCLGMASDGVGEARCSAGEEGAGCDV